MARRVDDLGRIVLPVEMRRMFGIQPGDELQIAVDGQCILLHKVEARCVFCGGIERLRPYRDKQVCAACAAGLLSFVDAVNPETGLPEAQGDGVDPPLGDVELGGHGG